MVVLRVLAFLALLASAAGLRAQNHVLVSAETVRVCPAQARGGPPDFASSGCTSMPFFEVDPQGRELWVEARFFVSPGDYPSDRPLGLFVTGKASSAVTFNGAALGSNGRPAGSRAAEIPGLMDAVFFVPRERVRSGENVAVLHLSSMNGYLRLSNPMHFIAFGPYVSPRQNMLAAYWPALITFGIFLIGALYFAIPALSGENRTGSGIVALASMIIALQLLSETSRGLFAYAYPLHDLRLLAIFGLACAFALSLFAYLSRHMLDWTRRRRLLAIAALAVVMAAIGLLEPGFDGKTLLALLAAVVASLCVAVLALRQQRSGAAPLLVILLLLVWAILSLRSAFLDLPFYLFAGAALAWLFYRQALAIIAERRLRRLEEKRANRLEFALAQRRNETEPVRLELLTAGRTDFVATDRIVRFSGAGDYVEAKFSDGTTELYDDTMTRLEQLLPADFVKVHRSHIVNTAFVRALEKDGTGTGTLIMADGSTVPVSRRIMPSIRESLAAGMPPARGAAAE